MLISCNIRLYEQFQEPVPHPQKHTHSLSLCLSLSLSYSRTKQMQMPYCGYMWNQITQRLSKHQSVCSRNIPSAIKPTKTVILS